MSVMNPGEIKKAPDTRMAAPSLSSRPGSTPWFTLPRNRPHTEMPARRTRTEPSTAVTRAMPRAQPNPIIDPTQMNAAISASATTVKRSTNLHRHQRYRRLRLTTLNRPRTPPDS